MGMLRMRQHSKAYNAACHAFQYGCLVIVYVYMVHIHVCSSPSQGQFVHSS